MAGHGHSRTTPSADGSHCDQGGTAAAAQRFQRPDIGHSLALRTRIQDFFANNLGPGAAVKLLRPTPVGLEKATASGDVATFATTEPHGFTVGETVKIKAVDGLTLEVEPR